MKHRKKRLPTRRKRALGRLALLLALAAFLSVFRLYAFLPAQALRLVEEELNTGSTEVIRRQWVPRSAANEQAGPWLVYLSNKGDTVVLCGLRFRFLTGWQPAFMEDHDCAPEAALSGQYCYNGTKGWAVGFLRIGDPSVTEVSVSFQTPTTEWEDSQARWKRTEVVSLRTRAAEWTEKDGFRYALVTADIREWPAGALYGPADLRATAYDAAGNVVAEYDTDDETWRR